jgi:hypothetical protein
MALGSTQPLTEMSTKNLPGGKGRPVRKANNLTAICEPNCLEDVRASTSHTPMGLHGLLPGYLYLFYLYRFNIIRVIKSLRTIWRGRVAHVQEMTNVYTILAEDH